jgi:hypothetical protein
VVLTTHPLLRAEAYKKRRAIPLLSLRACAACNRVKLLLTSIIHNSHTQTYKDDRKSDSAEQRPLFIS